MPDQRTFLGTRNTGTVRQGDLLTLVLYPTDGLKSGETVQCGDRSEDLEAYLKSSKKDRRELRDAYRSQRAIATCHSVIAATQLFPDSPSRAPCWDASRSLQQLIDIDAGKWSRMDNVEHNWARDKMEEIIMERAEDAVFWGDEPHERRNTKLETEAIEHMMPFFDAGTQLSLRTQNGGGKRLELQVKQTAKSLRSALNRLL
jgi:hypothetical protein